MISMPIWRWGQPANGSWASSRSRGRSIVSSVSISPCRALLEDSGTDGELLGKSNGRADAFRINFDLHRAGGLWFWLLLFVFPWSSVMLALRPVYERVTKA